MEIERPTPTDIGNGAAVSVAEHAQNTATTLKSQAHVGSWRDLFRVHAAADAYPMMTDDELQDLAEDIEQNGLREYIKLYQDQPTGDIFVIDGRNRLSALAMLGRQLLDEDGNPSWDYFESVSYHQDGGRFAKRDQPDPYAYVHSANLFRRHLTREQRGELIVNLLKSEPEKSNRQIAKEVGADDKTVGKVRADLERRAEIPHAATVTDTAGRKQPAKKATKQKPVAEPTVTVAATPAQPVEPIDTAMAEVVESAATADEDARFAVLDQQFGPLTGREWLDLEDDIRRVFRKKTPLPAYFQKLIEFHQVPLEKLLEACN